MRIGYFCYNLSGTGPSVRAQTIINAVASQTENNVVALTGDPELVSEKAEVVQISVRNPLDALWKVRKYFSKCDVVHVPVNIYQVAFVRLGYYGPLVGGIGPGLQHKKWHIILSNILNIDAKVRTHEYQNKWVEAGIENVMCTAMIDREVFHPYSERELIESRKVLNIPKGNSVILYVGKLTEDYGAGLVERMAEIDSNNTTTFMVVGDGPLKHQLQRMENVSYEGFVPNHDLPMYYNVADITVGPRKTDVTSNVGLESIACGTPFVTTAEGVIKRLFEDRGTYVWSDRTPEALWETVQTLFQNEEEYQRQVDRGLETLEERPLTIDSALETHIDLYSRLAK